MRYKDKICSPFDFLHLDPDERPRLRSWREDLGGYLSEMAPVVLRWSLFPDEYEAVRTGNCDFQPPSPLCRRCTKSVASELHHVFGLLHPPRGIPESHFSDCSLTFLPGGMGTFREPTYREFLEGGCVIGLDACGLSIPSHFGLPFPRFLLPRFSAVVSGSLQLFSLAAANSHNQALADFRGSLFRLGSAEMSALNTPSASLLKPWLAGECTSLLEDWRKNPGARSTTLEDLELLGSGKLDE